MNNNPRVEELISAIHKKCLECSGNSKTEVENCRVRDCPLKPYRSNKAMGRLAPIKTPTGQMTIESFLS